MLSLLIAMNSAFAVDSPKYEMSIHRELYETLDAPYGVVGHQDDLVGFRLGYQLNSLITFTASYSTASSGGQNSYYDYPEEPDSGSSGTGRVLSEYRSNHFNAGARFSLPLQKWLIPYASTEAQISHGHLQLGNSLDKDTATTLVTASGFGVGAVGLLGIELRSRPLFQKFQITGYFEGGAGITTPLQFSLRDFGGDEAGDSRSIGDLQYGGSVVRAGVGLRF